MPIDYRIDASIRRLVPLGWVLADAYRQLTFAGALPRMHPRS
jgi:hypothetical protein